MAQYCDGFVVATKDSDVIRGIGTKFVQNVKVGDQIVIKLTETTISEIIEITEVVSDTEIKIKTPFTYDYIYRTKYAIHRNFTINYKYPQTYLGDEIIAPFINSDIILIEGQFGVAHTGSYNFNRITSIYFKTNIVSVEEGVEISLYVFGLPGDTSDVECTFAYKTPDTSTEFFTIKEFFNNYVTITGIKITDLDSEHYIVATLVANTSMTAECKVLVLASNSIPITSFYVQEAIDVPLLSTALIRPVIEPANATNATFKLEYTASEFDPNFELKSEGRQIDVYGKALSENPITVNVVHETLGKKPTSIKCVDGVSTLQSLVFAPTSISIALFQTAPSVQIIFTPSLTTINKEIILSYTYDEFATYYEIRGIYNIATETVSIEIIYKEDSTLNRYFHSVTTSKIVATNPLSGKSTELSMTITYIPADSLEITTTGPVEVMVGQSASVYTNILPVNFSDKVFFSRIFDGYPENLIDISGTPGTQNTDEFKTDYPSPVIITGKVIGSTKLYIYSRNNNRFDSINVNVIEGNPGQLTDITVSDISSTHEVGQYGSIKVDFTPTDASNKSVRVTSSNPLIVKISENNTYSVVSGSYLTFSPYFRQYGTAVLTIETTDGSEITKTISVTTTGTVCDVPVSGIAFDDTTTINMVQGEARKFFVTVSPENASCQQVNYRVEEGVAAYITNHVRDGNTSQLASTDDYAYVIARNGYTGLVKISVYGLNNNFIGFTNIQVA